MRRVVVRICSCTLALAPLLSGCTSRSEIDAAVAQTERYRMALRTNSTANIAPTGTSNKIYAYNSSVAAANQNRAGVPTKASASASAYSLPQRMVTNANQDL